MALKRVPLPLGIDLEEGGKLITIRWPGGLTTRWPAFRLRSECPCALCVDEMTGRRTLRPEDVDPGVSASSQATVGRYAFRFHWSDGHNTGIYTFDALSQDPKAETTS
jgi:DUF971 family protein